MKQVSKKMILNGFKTTTLVTALSLSMLGFADAPVVDATSSNNSQPAIAQPAQSNATSNNTTAASNSDNAADAGTNLSLEQRVSKLEQQMANMNKANLTQQMSQLQDQMQSLSGQVQVEKKQLDQLNKQQRDFYQEVDSRISQLNTLVNNMNAASATTNNTGPVTSSAPTNTNNTSVKANASTSATANNAVTANSGTAATGSDQKELDDYQKAFSLVLSKNLSEADKALFAYLKNYPNGRYVPNAHYWLGEIALQDKDYKAAQQQFSIVVNQFPKNQKVADARLKLATVLQDLGKTAAAKTAYQSIIKDYPQSPSAQLAQVQLKQLGS